MSEIEKWAQRENWRHEYHLEQMTRHGQHLREYKEKHPIMYWLFGTMFA